MTMRVPAVVSSTKHDCPSQLSLPTTGDPAAGTRGAPSASNPSASVDEMKSRFTIAGLYLRAMSEKDAAGEVEPVTTLRDAAVEPAKQSIAEMLERLPAAPGVYI